MLNAERLLNERWKAETATENREAVDTLVISLEGTSKAENVSDDWQVPLG
jgi:hypothetical protein